MTASGTESVGKFLPCMRHMRSCVHTKYTSTILGGAMCVQAVSLMGRPPQMIVAPSSSTCCKRALRRWGGMGKGEKDGGAHGAGQGSTGGRGTVSSYRWPHGLNRCTTPNPIGVHGGWGEERRAHGGRGETTGCLRGEGRRSTVGGMGSDGVGRMHGGSDLWLLLLTHYGAPVRREIHFAK